MWFEYEAGKDRNSRVSHCPGARRGLRLLPLEHVETADPKLYKDAAGKAVPCRRAMTADRYGVPGTSPRNDSR
jgi:hypothetical protein